MKITKVQNKCSYTLKPKIDKERICLVDGKTKPKILRIKNCVPRFRWAEKLTEIN